VLLHIRILRVLLLYITLIGRPAATEIFRWRCIRSQNCQNVTNLGLSFRNEMSDNIFPLIQDFTIESSKIKTLSRNLVKVFPKLTTITVDNCSHLETLDLMVFGDQKWTKLTSIRINRNAIVQIEAEQFKGAENLDKLDLAMNQISKLSSEAFVGLRALTRLDLSKNQLESLPNELLAETFNITYLNLIGNRLKEVDLSQFNAMKKLGEVYLTHNQIERIVVETRNEAIEKLYLSHNLLEDVPDLSLLPRLKELYLSHNPNLKTTNITFDRLDKLALNDCGLMRDWDPRFLSSMKSLKSLDLASNAFTMLNISQFPQLPTLKYLFLSGNNLTEVGNSTEILEKFPALEVLDVANNPFSCDYVKLVTAELQSQTNLLVTRDRAENEQCLTDDDRNFLNPSVPKEVVIPPIFPGYHFVLIIIYGCLLAGMCYALWFVHRRMQGLRKVTVEHTKFYNDIPKQTLFTMVLREDNTSRL
jgi:Leucine-rich repeat (LRR) protein